MLDLQAIKARANARATATPANPANWLIEGDADSQRINQLATLAGVAGDAAIDNEASVSQLATLAGVDADERVTCGQCMHFDATRRRCGNHRRAGLRSAQLGLDLPTLPQRCGGFVRITA